MDERLAELERAFHETPGDAPAALRLATLYLRAGRPASALTVARGHDGGELRRMAATRLGNRLGVEFSHLTQDGSEQFVVEGTDPLCSLILVPAGAFLDDGPGAWNSSLNLGGSRAPLRPVTVPDILVGRVAREESDLIRAKEAALGFGGRLPTPEEWKKAWRGGLFLDGDTTALRANTSPDRMTPWGLDLEPDGIHARSPYGLEFMLGECEWSSRSSVGLILDVENGRYHVPLNTPDQRRGRLLSWRLVIDVPKGL